MRLKNQKIGPITLRSIDYAPNMSQETMAFTGMVKVKDVGESHVRNDGCGGDNYLQGSKAVSDAVEAFCKTLPDRTYTMGGKEYSYSMNGDVLVSLLLDRALNQKAGMPSACDGCGDTDHLELHQRTDLPGVVRKKKLWAPCLCDSCNKNSVMKSSA